MANAKSKTLKRGERIKHAGGSHCFVFRNYRGGTKIMVESGLSMIEGNADEFSWFDGRSWVPIRMIYDQKFLQQLWTVAAQNN